MTAAAQPPRAAAGEEERGDWAEGKGAQGEGRPSFSCAAPVPCDVWPRLLQPPLMCHVLIPAEGVVCNQSRPQLAPASQHVAQPSHPYIATAPGMYVKHRNPWCHCCRRP